MRQVHISAKPKGHFTYSQVMVMFDENGEPVNDPDNAFVLFLEIPQETGGVKWLPFNKNHCDIMKGYLH